MSEHSHELKEQVDKCALVCGNLWASKKECAENIKELKDVQEKLHSRISNFVLTAFFGAVAAIGGLVVLILGVVLKGGK